jgi:hypothetical protein
MVDPEDTDMYEEMEMDEMDEHGGGSLLTKKLVVPGQLVTDDPQFMRYSPMASLLRCIEDTQTNRTVDMGRMWAKKTRSSHQSQEQSNE